MTALAERAALILQRAKSFLDAAEETDLDDPRRRPVAFSNARTGVELAGKALLELHQGSFPKRHDIGGALYAQRLVPREVDPRALNDLLTQHTLGEYGFDDIPTMAQVEEAIDMGRALAKAAAAMM